MSHPVCAVQGFLRGYQSSGEVVYPLLLMVFLIGEVEGEVGEEEAKEEGVEEEVASMERPSIPHCALVPLCHHQ